MLSLTLWGDQLGWGPDLAAQKLRSDEMTRLSSVKTLPSHEGFSKQDTDLNAINSNKPCATCSMVCCCCMQPSHIVRMCMPALPCCSSQPVITPPQGSMPWTSVQYVPQHGLPGL